MYDKTLLKEKLIQILEALLKIQRRFSQIKTPADFMRDNRGEDMLDAIAMMLIAVGDNFKKIDKETGGTLLVRYPQIDWQGVKGIRDILAHHYFNINPEVIFNICSDRLPALIENVREMLNEADD
ncbi:MAG: HepT-like ribonuclease domain-containing protein [Thermoguttaceae bacterium]|jgi:uncharacterized protein with HEPN domain